MRLREVQTAEETGRIDALDAGTKTLAEVAFDFFRLHKSEWGETTAYGYAKIWNSAVEGESRYPRAAVADMAIRALRKSHITEWRNESIEVGIPESSVGRALSLIVRALDFACDEDLIDANPAARVKPPKIITARPTIITPEQVEAIRRQMTARDALFVSILAYAGCRPHEARALTAEDFAGDELHLTHACAADGALQALKSGHDERFVPICDALRGDVAAFDGSGLLFPNAHGGRTTKTDYDNWRKRRFKPALQAAAVSLPDDLNPYDMRASIASLWYRQGDDRATIASRLGHSIAVLDKRYLSHFKTLDALNRRSADELIAAARSGAV